MCSRCNLCPISNLYFPAIGEVQQETNKGIVSNFSQMKCWLGDSDKRYLAREIKLLLPLTLPILNLESSFKEGKLLFVVVICLPSLLSTQVLFSLKSLLQKNKRLAEQIKVFLWDKWKILLILFRWFRYISGVRRIASINFAGCGLHIWEANVNICKESKPVMWGW